MSYKRKLKNERIMEVTIGEYRLFISIGSYINKVTFGLPLENCRNKKVWVEQKGYADYLSLSKAKKLLMNALGKTAYGQLRMNPNVRALL